MLMIRLQRIGRKNDPAFRVLVLEKTRSPKAGSYTDLLGTYNPKTKAFTIQADRLKEWMGKGAQVSPTLHNLLVDKGVIEGKKTAAAVVSKTELEKNVAKKAAEAAAAAEAEAAAKAAAEAPAAEEAPVSSEAIEEAAIADAEPASEDAPAAEAAAEESPKEESSAA